MKLENQVTSLEISKRLKELGVEQISQWRWIDEDSPMLVTDCNVDWLIASAFTVAELGELLPAKIVNMQHKGLARGFYFKHPELGAGSETEADARGKMLIYLLENKLI